MPEHTGGSPRPVHPSETRVGWIGTGVMGAPMCRHLKQAGYRTTIHTRSRVKAASLLADGAAWCDTPHALAEQSDVVFTMVGFPQDVRDVYFGEHGLLAGARPGTIVVDMTTTAPVLAREIETAARTRAVWALDAPVSGGDVGARSGSLSIMLGGDRSAADAVRPLLERLGKNIVHHGGPGMGQQAKLSNQIVIAGTMIGVCEALLYSRKAGLDPARLLDSIRGGAAGCWTLDRLAPKILQGDFAPGFFVDHFVKDLGIALDECRRMGLSLPGLELAHRLYQRVQQLGHGRSGTQALILALEQMTRGDVEQAP